MKQASDPITEGDQTMYLDEEFDELENKDKSKEDASDTITEEDEVLISDDEYLELANKEASKEKASEDEVTPQERATSSRSPVPDHNLGAW